MTLNQSTSPDPGAFHADPLYLSALASLGASVPAKLMAAPATGSIAVLPFLNMSGDPEQEHFTDGLTDDIITDLSNVPGFFVIARNSTFAYKGKPADVRQIAHDLGVKYILEGSARRSDKRLRINVQLIDAAQGGNHVWAERFDREIADIFEVQDEVTRRVVEAIAGKLKTATPTERYRPTSLEAYDLVVLSRNQRAVSKSANDDARQHLERAIALDPNYCEAHWLLALVYEFAWQVWGEPRHNRRHALDLSRRAVEIDPNDSDARWVFGHMLQFDGRQDEAQAQYDESLRLNPNNSDALANLSNSLVLNGKPREALEAIAKALRLNPHPPGWFYWVAGFIQVADGQYDKAVITLRREETYRTASRRVLAAALALLGNIAEAKEEARLFLATNSHFRISGWMESQPFKNASDAEFWAAAYRLAGLPE